MESNVCGSFVRLASSFVAMACGLISANCAYAAEPSWKAGFARIAITPEEPMWMSGYGGRNKPAEGKTLDIYARAAAVEDSAGSVSIVVALDLIGVPPRMAALVAETIEKSHGIPRRHILFASSHTHCGPALDDNLSFMLDMKDADWAQVHKYQKILNGKVIDVIGQALSDRKPCIVAFGHGRAGFAANRRPPINTGPYDHDVPVLRFLSEDSQSVRGVIYGYACHATVMGFYEWSGDYPGFASAYLEDRHPGAVALFAAGCGADQNPLPRRKPELAEKYGRMLGVAVDETLKQPLTPVTGSIRADFTTTELAFGTIPSKEEWEKAKSTGTRFEQTRARLMLEELEKTGKIHATYPYPVQVWQVGDQFTWVALGGEVVVDYVLRLKQELGAERTWVTGYANDVMGYIPSERVLKEGGYEGASSMIVYQQPAPWKTGVEDQIIRTVHKLSESTRTKSGR